MKKAVGWLVVGSWLGACALPAADVTLTAANAEIVVAKDAPKATQFAAREMGTYLGTALGAAVPVVSEPTAGKASVILGSNAWSRAVGIDTAALVRDAFVTKTVAGRLYIAGRDHPRADIARMLETNSGDLSASEHATLFGVYAFLEDYAGCRFFFPGELGTVIPRHAEIAVPALDKTTAPVFTVRNPYIRFRGAAWPGETENMTAQERANHRRHQASVMWLRHRLQTEDLPCCHGQNGFYYQERFRETHPEYFCCRADGTRETQLDYNGQPFHYTIRHLCHTSKVWDEIYADVKAYLTGQDAATRGIPAAWDKTKFAWNGNCRQWNGGRVVDIMPQDGSRICCCPNCQKLNLKDQAAESELIWGNTARLANRLKAEGVKGSVTMMAYGSYGHIPKVDIPDNVHVMVARTGPWNINKPAQLKRELSDYRAWMEKTHGKVWIWTYPHKWEATSIPDVPCMAPKAWGKYYQLAAPYIFGSFAECETDRAIFNYLNAYVFAKIAWNPDLDLEALLDDHHAKMFGKGAAEMKQFYEELEAAWFRVAGNLYWDNLGPHGTVPSLYTLATDVYSPARLDGWSKLCDAAVRKNADDPVAQRRIEFIRREFILPLAARFKGYVDSISADKGLAKRAGQPDRTTLIKNGGFEEITGWEALPAGETKLALDAATFLTGKHALRMTGGATNRFSYAIQHCTFKPGTKYRISYFQKLQDVKAFDRNGGVFCECFDGDWHWFPNKTRAMTGTTDWVYREYEFQTDAQPKRKSRQYFRFMFSGATGTAWFDDVRIEELPPDAVLAEEKEW